MNGDMVGLLEQQRRLDEERDALVSKDDVSWSISNHFVVDLISVLQSDVDTAAKDNMDCIQNNSIQNNLQKRTTFLQGAGSHVCPLFVSLYRVVAIECPIISKIH